MTGGPCGATPPRLVLAGALPRIWERVPCESHADLGSDPALTQLWDLGRLEPKVTTPLTQRGRMPPSAAAQSVTGL